MKTQAKQENGQVVALLETFAGEKNMVSEGEKSVVFIAHTEKWH